VTSLSDLSLSSIHRADLTGEEVRERIGKIGPRTVWLVEITLSN